MKTFRILTLMLLAILALGSCSTDEVVAPGAALDGAPNVRFTLGGAAKVSAQSRATIESENGEKTVNTLLAVLFDTHKGFYKTVEARPEDDGYGIMVEDDATYDIYLVANADDDLRTALEGISEGTSADC
ncbi:MAG: hypothetical protein K2H87_01475, partial [Duncaniella sp.]|nr:hypothetical protein [Duncaniella sp.]